MFGKPNRILSQITPPPLDDIYFNFQKAFDEALHDKVILKVEAFGITGKICSCLGNCLCNGEQRVVINS